MTVRGGFPPTIPQIPDLPTSSSKMQRELAFRPDTAAKSKETMAFERNTYKKNYRETCVERDTFRNSYHNAVQFMKQTAMDCHKTTPNDATRVAVWAIYEKYPEHIRVFSRDSTGQKTHKGRAKVMRNVFGGKEEQEIDAHLTPDGDYYKPWNEGDEPSYFLQDLRINPYYFTLTDEGVFKPNKLY